MKRIADFISSIRTDHKAHLIVGVVSGFPMVLLFGNIGGLIAVIIYALKEVVYDQLLGRGKMEFLDWLYSSIPVIQLLIIHNL
tara:strand:- start:290 stop:538 length:249 start_codon:yes stop_codon:yes gene_type:complete